MAVVFLRKVAIILTKLNQHSLATEAEKLAKEIDDGVKRYGIITHQSKPICKHCKKPLI
jgi:meiotically up-regulated gene 157 (Mug157) protein